MTRRSCIAAACFLLLVLPAVFLGAAAAACDKMQLAPCATGIQTGVPSAQCCVKLREMQPCFCELLKDPVVRRLIGTPQAKKMAATCRVTIPKC